MTISTLENKMGSDELCKSIKEFLDDRKALDIIDIDIRKKSTICDYMVIASGTSQRHLQMTAELLKEHLHSIGIKPIFTEGTGDCDWVLLDAGDVIVHLFRPEVRTFYNLEKMWGVDIADFSRKAAEIK